MEVTPSMNKVHHGTLWKRIKKHKLVYLLLFPSFATVLIFNYAPMAGILMAFKNFRIMDGFWGIFTGEWIGFKNFERLFASYYFYDVFRNTILISLYKIIFGFPAPIILALLLNELKNKFYTRFVQTITYLPHFLGAVILTGLTYALLNPSYGIVNGVIQAFGYEPQQFLADPRYFRSIIVGLDVWKNTGWNAIIFLAAISSVDMGLYDAAKMDGANKFRQMWHITLPGISEIVVLMFILRLGDIMNAGFDQIFLLYSVMVYNVGDIIDTYVYRMGLVNSEYGFSTAVGLFKSVIALILIIAANAVAKKFGKQGIW